MIVLLRNATRTGENDFKIAVISSNSLRMVSISPGRKMINTVILNGEMPIWVPYGGGWYRINQIDKIINKEEKSTQDLLYYNFGFIPDKSIYSENGEVWKSNKFLIGNIGLIGWVKFKFNQYTMLKKEEELSEDWGRANDLLDEIMPRDFADNRIVNDELRLSIFNATNENGLANFIGKRLEWMGYSVVSSDNTTDKIDNCMVVYGPKTETSFAFLTLNNMFDCQKKYEDGLNENEAELYFGEKYVSVVKYSSYNSIKN